MRVVIDTNVLISGTFWSSASFQILKLIDADRLELIVSKEILEEYDELLHRDEIVDKTAYSQEKANAATNMLKKAALVEVSNQVRLVKDDPDDDKFIDAALAGTAKYIISQDSHLLRLKEVLGIRIITPEDLLELMRQ